MRVLLANPGMNFNDMKSATEVSTRLLPATPEEIKKDERRVSYIATMHATEDYRKRRIAFLNKNLQRALAGNPNAYDAQSCRKSLARLKPAGYTISRTVRVRNTPDGWQVIESTNAAESPRAWLYDVYYER